MTPLEQKILAARESWATVEGFDFLIRVPTMLEQVAWREFDNADFVRRVIVNWRNVREIDLYPGGDGSEPLFDVGAFIQWASDRPSLWIGIVQAVRDEIRRRAEKMEAAEKRDVGSGGNVVPPAVRPGPAKRDAERSGGGGRARGVGADGEAVAVGNG